METIRRDEVLIEASELQAILDQPHVRVFDATVLMGLPAGEPDARAVYDEGHIPNAGFFDHQHFSDASSPYSLTLAGADHLGAELGKAGVSNDSLVVVYSTDLIIWATRVWWLLRYAGHKNVRVLNGGLEAWTKSGGAVSVEACSYPETEFSCDFQPGYFVNKEDIQNGVTDSGVKTVHSLPRAMFDQAHIPGSVCQPFSDFLSERGTALLPNEELEQLLVENHASGRTVTYCGGGVAATLNAVVCRLVGNPDVAVYDGSMSEWVGEGMPTESTLQPE